MLFNSVEFGFFFPVVLILYWTLFKKNVKLRNLFLIAVSYFFYACWDWRFLSLIIISSLVDFWVGGKLFAEDDKRRRKLLLVISLAVNLGFLGFFKYYNFFVDSFVEAFSLMGMSFGRSSLDIVLPVGISFYTFQTLSYTLDIYHRRMEPTRDLISFLAFVSFFPQLVAGPIERARNFLPQFYEKKSFNYEQARSGMLLVLWGLFKKIMIADRVGRYVDTAYGDISSLQGIEGVVAMIFFGFQLYLDFSAYSDIAIGGARIMGFELSTNFKRPYLASSFSDFWRRWHISLSSWFRDYVYIPLGGSRSGGGRTMINIMVVFTLSGLWHGASWNFVIWGAINGLFLIVLDKVLMAGSAPGLARKAFNAVVVTTGWFLSLIFFRAQSFDDAMDMFTSLGTGITDHLYTHGLNAKEFSFTIYLLVLLVAFEIVNESYSGLNDWFRKRWLPLRWSVYLGLTLMILLLGSYGIGLNDSQFIYFQF